MAIQRKVSLSLGTILIYFTVGAAALICVLPLLLVLSGSLSKENEVMLYGYSILPRHFSLDAYRVIFANQTVFRSYGVSALVTSVGTLLGVLVISGMAYAMSSKSLKYRGFLTVFVIIPMLFSGGIVPLYVLCRRYLHLYDNYWAMIVPYLVQSFWILVLRNFFRSIPDSLLESAKIDGAGDMRILFQIMLPLSIPSIATIGLFYALMYWNDWFLALLLVDDSSKFPVQMMLRGVISTVMGANSAFVRSPIPALPNYTVRMATCIMAMGPIVLIFPFIQKFFIKGLTIGAIKG